MTFSTYRRRLSTVTFNRNHLVRVNVKKKLIIRRFASINIIITTRYEYLILTVVKNAINTQTTIVKIIILE